VQLLSFIRGNAFSNAKIRDEYLTIAKAILIVALKESMERSRLSAEIISGDTI
jgi:hypothetical protein